VHGCWGLLNVRRWVLWSQRRRLIAYCLTTEATGVAVTLAATHASIRWGDARLLAALVGMGVLQAELARQVERVRRRLTATPHINMSSVWTFAGVLLLPVQLIPILVATLYAHLAVRSWYRLRRVPPFRTVFNASLVTLTCLAARGTLAATHFPGLAAATHRGPAGALPILAAAAVYFTVAAVIAIPGLSLESVSIPALLGSWSDNALEATTIGLGAITAVLLAVMPVLALAIVPPMLLVQRSVLVKQLELAATTDEKTGLLNTAGWRHLAAQQVGRAPARPNASLGVLMIDVDHFKRTNDQYGHLAGDEVLQAVADCISAEVRGYDSVGRFGGEEFVVLLPDASGDDVAAVAERIRRAVSAITLATQRNGHSALITGISVSIGIAMYPTAGPGLDTLLHAADSALYQAKRHGRNRVAVFEPA
jgi:diguanylate cyclase (GGDEF)-like protein